MAAIEIPADYWNIEPAGFSALVQGFSPAFADIYGSLGDASNGLTAAVDGDTGAAVATMDGDADVLDVALGEEAAAAGATPTGNVLASFGGGDHLTSAADSGVAAVSLGAPSGGAYTPSAPPEVPGDVGAGPGGGGGAPGGGGGEPEPQPEPEPPTNPEPQPNPQPNPEPNPEPEPEPEPLPADPTVDPGAGTLPPDYNPGPIGGGGTDPDPIQENLLGPVTPIVEPPAAAPAYVTYDDLAAVLSVLDLTINVQV